MHAGTHLHSIVPPLLVIVDAGNLHTSTHLHRSVRPFLVIVDADAADAAVDFLYDLADASGEHCVSL